MGHFGGVLGRVLAAAAVLSGVACASPPPPRIPDRSVVGPPDSAARSCPPVIDFAQAWFRLADLDRGESCSAFLEQDECVLAVAHDCTFDAAHLRSWQGFIDHAERITLNAAYGEGGAVQPRAPAGCSGKLQRPVAGGPWARLACTFENVATMPPHAGFYLERQDGAPLYHLGTPLAVTPPGSAAVLSGLIDRANTHELWAIAAAPGGGDAGVGLYVGTRAAGALSHQPIVLTAPSLIEQTADGLTVVIADRATLVRVDAEARTSTSVTVAGSITGLAVLGSQALVSSGVLPRSTRLELYDLATLKRLQNTVVDGVVTAIHALTTTTGPARALLAFDTPVLGVVTSTLGDRGRIALDAEGPPRAIAILPGTATVALAFPGTYARYVELDLDRRERRLVLAVPDVPDVIALRFDRGGDRVLAAARGGRISLIDRAEQRPILGSALTLTGENSPAQLALDPADGVAYVLGTSSRVIYPLVR